MIMTDLFGVSRSPASETQLEQAWLPYLGGDFGGMPRWLEFHKEAKESGVTIKCPSIVGHAQGPPRTWKP